MLCHSLAELHLVDAVWDLREDVEGASWPDILDTAVVEHLADDFPGLVVEFEVGGRWENLRDNSHVEPVGMDEAHDLVGVRKRVNEELVVLKKWVDDDTAEPFSWDGDILGEGVADDAVVVALEDLVALLTRSDDTCVHVVAEDVDWPAVLLGLLLEHLGHGFDAVLLEDDTGWVVWGVDDDGPGARVDSFTEFFGVDLPAFLEGRLDLLHDTVEVLYVEWILEEVRGEENNLVTWAEDAPEGDVHGTCASRGEDDVFRTDWNLLDLGEHVGEALAWW